MAELLSAAGFPRRKISNFFTDPLLVMSTYCSLNSQTWKIQIRIMNLILNSWPGGLLKKNLVLALTVPSDVHRIPFPWACTQLAYQSARGFYRSCCSVCCWRETHGDVKTKKTTELSTVSSNCNYRSVNHRCEWFQRNEGCFSPAYIWFGSERHIDWALALVKGWKCSETSLKPAPISQKTCVEP